MATILHLLVILLVVANVKSKNIDDDPDVKDDPYHLVLAKTAECSTDVNRICGAGIIRTNFQVISCLQDGHKDFDVSEPCQHVIWSYKRNLTMDPKYEGAVQKVCSSMIQKIPDCQKLEAGHLIPCLIEYLDNSTSIWHPHCQTFLSRLKPVVFSDYRIIYKFSDACRDDIDKFQCGRMDKPEADDFMNPHQQGKVLTCLAKELMRLTKTCKHELLRVAELQADDYHNDRQLFFACRNDRERFCSKVESGEGRVYACLIKHKMDQEMSQMCHNLLVVRQKMQQEDYKINLGLSKACHEDILDHHCIRHLDRIPGFSDARMSAILLCLEAAMKDGKEVRPECRSELKEMRRSLMEDFQISPSLVVDCAKEIELHCRANLDRGGGTIHCLMDIARPKLRPDKQEFAAEISAQCARSLEDVLLQADVGENYAVDPALKHACDSVVQVYCSHLPPGDGMVMTCLVESLDMPRMTEECKESLFEIQYFINRDFRLDPRLYKSCKVDAVRLCQAPKKWYTPEGEISVEHGYLVFACLYRHVDLTSDNPNYKSVSRQCAAEIKRVMRERAVSVNLDPDVENECLSDLTKFCLEKSLKDEEMMCLEDNLERLSSGCNKVIGEFIENSDRDPSINGIFLRACEPFWQEYCKGGSKRLRMEMIDEPFEKDLMSCLISNKDHPAMDARCRAGIEYHQIMLLKDYHFSHKFKMACAQDVATFCALKNDKAYVVGCLSDHVLNDTLLQRKQRVSVKCNRQLSVELLQRSNSISLDPELAQACKPDVESFCSRVTQGQSAVIECLMAHMKNLSKKCHKKMFKRLEMEALNPKTDYFLYTKCKSMIKKYCVEELSTPELLFSCLQRNQEEDNFDERCKEAVLSRAHVFAKDIRLNRELSRACYSDVMEFCRVEANREEEDDGEDEGRVVECLKKTFIGRNKQKRLTANCERHVRILIRMSAQDFKLDVALVNACEHEIASMCHDASELNRGSETDGGEVEACLKDHLLKGTISKEHHSSCHAQVQRLVEESIVDVQVDTRLYKYCAIDIKSFCGDIPKGEGRQLECLLLQMSNNPDSLTDECVKNLNQRMELWKKVKPDLPSNLQEVAQMVSTSPSAHYFLFIFVAFVSFIFVGGLCFGRITKRIKRDMKDR